MSAAIRRSVSISSAELLVAAAIILIGSDIPFTDSDFPKILARVCTRDQLLLATDCGSPLCRTWLRMLLCALRLTAFRQHRPAVSAAKWWAEQRSTIRSHLLCDDRWIRMFDCPIEDRVHRTVLRAILRSRACSMDWFPCFADCSLLGFLGR